jgi:hypothetical protein
MKLKEEKKDGRGCGIRTRDPLLPKQMRYHCANPREVSDYCHILFPKASNSQKFLKFFLHKKNQKS